MRREHTARKGPEHGRARGPRFAVASSRAELRLRQAKPTSEPSGVQRTESDTGEGAFERIRCPACLWQPTSSSRWYCTDCGHPEHYSGGCGMAWNTFETRGRCPGCHHQWRWTACLSCTEWSLHEDWYMKEPNKLD